MQLEEYKVVMRSRFNSLSDEEKLALGKLGETPVGDLLFKVLGPELTGSTGSPQEQPPQEEIQPRRMGLGSR